MKYKMDWTRKIYFKICLLYFIVIIKDVSSDPNLDIENTHKSPFKKKRVEILLDKWDDENAKLVKNNHIKTESEIAAVFFGVAYGAPTPDPLKSTTISNHLNSADVTKTLEEGFSVMQKSKFLENSSTNVNLDVKSDKPPKSDLRETSGKRVSNPPKFDEVLKKDEQSTTSYDEPYLNKSLEDTHQDREGLHMWVRISNQLGIVWSLHLHVFEFLFCFVAAVASVCVLSLGCSQTKSLSKLISLLFTLIMIVACIRATQLFIDPYGVYNYLPKVISNIMQHILPPSIVTILSLFLFLLTNNTCVKLILLPKGALFGISFCFTVNVVIMDTIAHFMEISEVLTIIDSVVIGLVASWGVVLCLGFVVVILKIEKMTSKQNHKNKRINDTCSANSYPHYIKTASRFGAAAGFAQLLISGLIVYTLAGPKDPPGTSYLLTWAWWLHHTLARLLEVILCLCVTIGAAFMAFHNRSFTKSPFIFPLLRICCKTKASGVHPSKVPARQPLDIFTIPKPDNESVDYVTSDFQLVWTQNRAQSSQSFAANFNSNRKPLNHGSLKRTNSYDKSFSATLPYKTKIHTQAEFCKPINEETIQVKRKPFKETQNVVVTNYNYLNDVQQISLPSKTKSSDMSLTAIDQPPKHCQTFHSEAPDLANSLYWSPCSVTSISDCQPSFNLASRTSHSFDQISESNTVSPSEFRIDYLTDISSSVDGASIGSEINSPLGLVGVGRWHPAHTLPFRTFRTDHLQDSKSIAKDIMSRSETNTPLLEPELNYPSG